MSTSNVASRKCWATPETDALKAKLWTGCRCSGQLPHNQHTSVGLEFLVAGIDDAPISTPVRVGVASASAIRIRLLLASVKHRVQFVKWRNSIRRHTLRAVILTHQSTSLGPIEVPQGVDTSAIWRV